ncbi:hypothetical protein [Phocoenobacter skyensis]|uniref:Uncharacterized protein n=1 Tax=Phocoenobacter skyensis TaxID=97481 RepID=A0AAJ6P1U0_9PAST|nr:hypothetical protein [Pasteurella skyensis]MDP8174059.1 hypothetical protein [Pasteurella skyensis]
MSYKQTIEDQLAWCNTTRDRLDEFEYAIISVANGYDSITDELKNTPVFGEFIKQVEYRQEMFRGEMKTLLQQVHTENKAYVDKQSKRLSQELSNVG